jgi:hypothetical protein
MPAVKRTTWESKGERGDMVTGITINLETQAELESVREPF